MFFLHIPLNTTATIYVWRFISLNFSSRISKERLAFSLSRNTQNIDTLHHQAVEAEATQRFHHEKTEVPSPSVVSLPGQIDDSKEEHNLHAAAKSRAVSLRLNSPISWTTPAHVPETFWYLNHSYLLAWKYAGVAFTVVLCLEFAGTRLISFEAPSLSI